MYKLNYILAIETKKVSFEEEKKRKIIIRQSEAKKDMTLTTILLLLLHFHIKIILLFPKVNVSQRIYKKLNEIVIE